MHAGASRGQSPVVGSRRCAPRCFHEEKWTAAPFKPINNVNGFDVKREDIFTMDRHKGVLAIQEAMVRKIVAELKGADNVIFEMTHSRNRDLASADWERHMNEVFFVAQKKVGDKKILATNFGTGRDPGEVIDHPRIGMLSHNLADQSLFDLYPGEKRPIAMAETGFAPSTDREARFGAWTSWYRRHYDGQSASGKSA